MNDIFCRLLRADLRTYETPGERAALRAALGDAAALCDHIAETVLSEARTRKGKGPPSKEGSERAAIAKRCADTIWDMRRKIDVPHPRTPRHDRGA